MKLILVLLGWYLDLLVYLTASALCRHAFAPGMAWSFLYDLGVFAVLRAVAMHAATTPGEWLVAPAVAERSAKFAHPHRQWANLLLGTLMFLEGTKSIVRWLEMDQPMPFMGLVPEGATAQAAVAILLGLLFLAAGATLLRLEPFGRLLGFAAAAITAVSTGLSWGMWDGVIERLVVAHRTAQGLAVRGGEIAFMQNLFPEAIVVALALTAGLLLLCRGRNA